MLHQNVTVKMALELFFGIGLSVFQGQQPTVGRLVYSWFYPKFPCKMNFAQSYLCKDNIRAFL